MEEFALASPVMQFKTPTGIRWLCERVHQQMSANPTSVSPEELYYVLSHISRPDDCPNLTDLVRAYQASVRNSPLPRSLYQSMSLAQVRAAARDVLRQDEHVRSLLSDVATEPQRDVLGPQRIRRGAAPQAPVRPVHVLLTVCPTSTPYPLKPRSPPKPPQDQEFASLG